MLGKHETSTTPRAPRRLLLKGAALLPIALAAAVSHSSTTRVGLNWAATDAKAFMLPGMTDLGAADTHKVLPLMVTLKLQNRAALDAYFRHFSTVGDPLYQHTLSPAEFADAYAPSMSQVAGLIDFLSAQGFTGIELSPNRTQIRLQGTVAQAQAAFNTTLRNVTFQGARAAAITNTTPAQVPAAFGDLVLGVVGLSTVPTHWLNHPKRVSASPDLGPPATPPATKGFTGAQFLQAYDVGATPDGSKVAIAIMTEGDMVSVVGSHPDVVDPSAANFDKTADLRVAEKAFGLPYVPVTVVQLGTDHSDESGADEWDLDTQSSTGMASNVKKLYIYDAASLSDVEILDMYNKYVTDNLALAADSSFGGCDSLEQAGGTLGAYDQLLLQMAVQGQNMFASSGDGGSACLSPANGVPAAGVQGASSPASSPYVIGVGGTNLTVDSSGNYDVEAAWESSGGGVSEYEKAPAWTTAIIPTGAAGFRATPDIAMSGGELSPYATYIGGTREGVAGTSQSSPMALGVWARLQSARVSATNANPLGFAGPVLYNLAVTPTAAAAGAAPMGFHDIITGANGTYAAMPGYDYITGIGTFDIAAIHKVVVAKALPSTAVAPVLGGDVCPLPGNKVAVGAAGSNADAVNGTNTPATSAHNVLATYVSEHYDLATNKVDGFTLSMDVGAIGTGKEAYFVYFAIPGDSARHFVAYEATPDPQASAKTPFTYGHITETDVNDPTASVFGEESVYYPVVDGTTTGTASGTRISIFLPRSAVPKVVAGQQLRRVFAEVDAETTFMDKGMSNVLNALNSTNQGSFTPDAPNFCAPAPIAALTATPTTLFAGSAVAFDASTSTATIGPVTSYSFDFGDGTKATQKAATANHVYTTAGKYTASVAVTDSNQKTSTNAPTQAITVQAPVVDKFGFAARTGVDVSMVVTSETVTISGTAGASFPISISGGTNAQYQINSGAFTSDPGTIKAGDKLTVRQTSSAAYTTKTSATVTVGTYSTTFDVTTKDKPAATTPTSGSGSGSGSGTGTGSGSTGTGTGTGTTTAGADHVPDAFDFGETDGVNPGQVYTSKAIVPQNYDDAPITATQLSYSIDGAAFTTAKGTIKKGQTVRVQMTSSKASLGYAKGYITVGGVKATYTLRTKK